MAIAAARSPSLVFDVAKATAEEMRAVGFNWNLAPVLDVNSDPRNPVIGVRSFGDNPSDVGRFGVTTAEGLNAGGVAGISCEISLRQLHVNISLDMVPQIRIRI
jgi:beta-N-acetylhexosaminidase